MIAVRLIATALIALFTASVATASTTVASTAVVAQAEAKIVHTRASGQEDIPRRHEVFIMGAGGTDAVRLMNNVREDAFPTLATGCGPIRPWKLRATNASPLLNA